MLLLCLFLLLSSGSLCLGQAQEDLVGLANQLRATTLVKLLQIAGLESTIARSGPFTVFAPTNAAFSRLPSSTVLSLLADPKKLSSVLQAHVVRGRILKSSVRNEAVLTTINGQKIRANAYREVVTIGGARVAAFDKRASNGIIHVLNDVIIPTSQDIIGLVSSNDDLSTLLTTIRTTGLTGAIRTGPVTVFAPTNAAFKRLGDSVVQKLLQNRNLLGKLLQYHVVQGTRYSAGIESGMVTTLAGNTLDIKKYGRTVCVNYYRVRRPDISATNGVVHIIDTVLIPSDWHKFLGSVARLRYRY